MGVPGSAAAADPAKGSDTLPTGPWRAIDVPMWGVESRGDDMGDEAEEGDGQESTGTSSVGEEADAEVDDGEKAVATDGQNAEQLLDDIDGEDGRLPAAWSWPKKKPAAVRLSRRDNTSSGLSCPLSLARRLICAAFSHTSDNFSASK